MPPGRGLFGWAGAGRAWRSIVIALDGSVAGTAGICSSLISGYIVALRGGVLIARPAF